MSQGGRGGSCNGSRRMGRGGGRGYAFTQNAQGGSDRVRAPPGTILVPGTDGRTCNALCYRCQTWGHYADHCPTTIDIGGTGRQGTGLVQLGYTLNQCDGGIPVEWLLLDTCSTDSVFSNCSFLGDIVACDDSQALSLNSNGGGKLEYYLRSRMNLFPLDVFYNEYSVGNIISFFDLIQVDGILITLDSREGQGFNVIFEGKLYCFKPYENGLYYYDSRAAPVLVGDKDKSPVYPYSFLQSVEDNKAFYTANEIKGADSARRQQEEIGWPSDVFYHHIIKENSLTNTEVTIDDVQRAEHIYGPAKPILQGTMTRQRPTGNKINKISLPLPISTHHSSVSISVDFFFVNGHAFLTSKSRKLNFITAKYHKTRSMKEIITTLNEIRQLYDTRGFRVENIHGDNEFNKESIKIRNYLHSSIFMVRMSMWV